MTINFSVGDWLLVNEVFLKSLKQQAVSKQTLGSLGNLKGTPSEVLAVGNTPYPVTSFIRVRPKNVQHIGYNGGIGTVVYFSSDTLLNNSFEMSTAYLQDMEIVRCLNSSGSLITKNQVVRQTGFDVTEQLPTVDLADATTATNAVVLGVLQEDIADGQTGSILVNGSFQFDTSSYTLGTMAYLSDTPGAIASSAGTTSVTVGRVLSVGTEGTISLFSVLTGSVGGATGGGGGGSVIPIVVENKTSDFSVTATDVGKAFTNVGAGGTIKATADAGLPIGFYFWLSRIVSQEIQFQPESGGRVGLSVGAGFAGVDAAVKIITQIITVQYLKTSTGWVPIPDGSNTASVITMLELVGFGISGITFMNTAANAPPWSITCKAADVVGTEVPGVVYGTLADSGAGPVYTPGGGGPAEPYYAFFEVSIPGGGTGPSGGMQINVNAGISDLSTMVIDSPTTFPGPLPYSLAIAGGGPIFPSSFEVKDGDSFYADSQGLGYWRVIDGSPPYVPEAYPIE